MVAHRVREASTGGSTFEMSCQVTGQNLKNPGYSVLIRFEEILGGKSRKVLSLNQDSVLQLEEWSEPSRIDSVVLEKTGQLEYRFRLYGAQITDRGFYYCDVTSWTRDQSQDWIKAVSVESTKIEIAFVHTGIVMLTTLDSVSFNTQKDDAELPVGYVYSWGHVTLSHTFCSSFFLSDSGWLDLYSVSLGADSCCLKRLFLSLTLFRS